MTKIHALALLILAAVAVLVGGPAIAADLQSPPTEQQLIEILRSGQPAEKAIACKQLAVVGSAAAVPELAKLLGDPQLSSWSRIALEAIPDKAADDALIAAVATVKGRQLVGVINSIGVRRSAAAIAPLAGVLRGEPGEAAAAAAVALGRINGQAAKVLREALQSTADQKLRVAVAEGCILCAERLAATGHADEAAAIYDEVRKADVSPQRTREATRGAILARGG
ncbi:MAG: PBS lyase, partial [Planctomycetota bacterium]